MTLMSKFKNVLRFSNLMKVPSRNGGHGPTMIIQRTDYSWSQFKDYLHFYILLGVIPLTIVTTYANIFIGHAELTEIPEGYTPHYYEYFKSPVSRFLAKYYLYDKARDYETMVGKANEEAERLIIKNITRELRQRMSELKDNKGFYYVPGDMEQIMHYKNYIKEQYYTHHGHTGPHD